MKFKKLEYGLVICLAMTLPWHSQVTLPFATVNMSLGDPIIMLIGFLFITGFLFLREVPSISKQVIGLLLIAPISLLIAILRPSMSVDITSGIVESVKLFAAISYFIGVLIVFKEQSSSKIYFFAVSTLILATIVSIWTSIQLVMGVRRPAGPFDNPNLYADYLLFALFLGGVIINRLISRRETNYYHMLIFIIPFLLIIFSLLGTQSRSAIVALIIAVVFIPLVQWRDYLNLFCENPNTVYIPIAGLIGFTTLLFSRDWAVVNRFEGVLDRSGDTGGRFERWEQSFEIFLDSLFLGVGWGQHESYLPRDLHNTLIQVLVEAGIVGVVLLMLIWILSLRRGIQLSTTESHNYVIYITAFLIATTLNSAFHNNLHFRTFWITIGIIGVLEVEYIRKSIYNSTSADRTDHR